MDNRFDNKNSRNSRDNQNRRENRKLGNESSPRHVRKTSGGIYQDSGYQSSKTVKKVENTRFYERENPEANMRRRGKTVSDFENEKRDLSSSSKSYRTQNDVPQYESVNRTSASSERRRADRSFLYDTDTDIRLSRNKSTDSARSKYSDDSVTHKSSGLFDNSDDDDENDVFSEENNDTSKVGRKAKAAERLASKRREKQRRKEIMSKSNDRSFRRRVVSKKRQNKIRAEQIFKVLICILIIAIVLAITLSVGNYDDPYGTSHVVSGSISFSTRANSCFIREEEVYKAPVSGILVAAVNEGEKVAAGTGIAYVTTAEHTDIVAKLEDVENKIDTVKNAGSNSLDAFSDDVKHIDRQIAEVAREMSLAQSNGNMSKYNELKSRVDMLYSQRNGLISDSQSGNSYLVSLERERESLLNKLKTYTHEITATSAGVVSFNIDGYESEFASYIEKLSKNAENVAISPETIAKASVKSNNYVGKSIAAGDNVVKMVTSSEYYIASVVAEDVKVKVDSTVSLKSINREYSADVHILTSKVSEGKTVILSKTSKSLASSLPSRCVESDIITGTYSGMKVPLSALTEFDKAGTTARLTLLESNYAVYAYVDILAKDNEYAIISNKSSFADAELIAPDGSIIENDSTYVSVNDIFFLNPSVVKEGEVMK